jgi:hypothetical protein
MLEVHIDIGRLAALLADKALDSRLLPSGFTAVMPRQ